MTDVRYRIYADGNVVHEDDFEEMDNLYPNLDDYRSVRLPWELVDYIESCVSEDESKDLKDKGKGL